MKTGKIYKVISAIGDEVYVGSTLNTTRDRFKIHKGNYKNYKKGKHNYVTVYDLFDKYGMDNCRMILIKEYEVVDKLQLRAYEQLWINRTNCINKYCAFQVLHKERNRLYRENNKIEISKYKKLYRQNNKEFIKQQMKEYRQNNRDKLNEYNKLYCKNNEDKIKEQKKEYRQKNKEIINAKIKCELCNVEINKRGLKRHNKSKKHMNNLQ